MVLSKNITNDFAFLSILNRKMLFLTKHQYCSSLCQYKINVLFSDSSKVCFNKKIKTFNHYFFIKKFDWINYELINALFFVFSTIFYLKYLINNQLNTFLVQRQLTGINNQIISCKCFFSLLIKQVENTFFVYNQICNTHMQILRKTFYDFYYC